MLSPLLPAEQWRPAVPLICSTPQRRAPELLRQVAGQFDVVHAQRYQPGGGRTWCNIFLWDATTALGAEIPHWVDLAGQPVAPGHGAELSANAVVHWLELHGPAHGWSECNERGAREAAAQGRPAVAVWANPMPGHSGHVALVLPDSDPHAAARIAQAGAHNLFDAPLFQGFGSVKPRFFQHA
jgi:hypothetical protein